MTNRVVVVGSGAAGLAAALGAAEAGADVTLIERDSLAGGTTALSGGMVWLPGNHLDPDTSGEGVRTYLDGLAEGDSDLHLLDVFVDEAGRVADDLGRMTPIEWQTVPYPDYHAERDGGSHGGRALEPQPLSVPTEIAKMVRDAPNLPASITHRELLSPNIDFDVVADRRTNGVLTMGAGLVAGLLSAVVNADVDIRFSQRARALTLGHSGQVEGLATDDGTFPGRVILASGGFERDPALTAAFLAGPVLAATGSPGCEGDGLRMAMSVGAELGNMSQAWWCPAMTIPGETLDGYPISRPILSERAWPGSIMVDVDGRRFADEAQNYSDLGRSLHAFDPGTYRHRRIPSWLVFDHAYRKRRTLGPLRRRDPDPSWLVRGDSLADLAARLEIPEQNLIATVKRFNQAVEAGEDADFGRGSRVYDRHMAGENTLGRLSEPPFYAIKMLPGTLGTKGGPRTDDVGRVVSVTGGIIPGLFAAGNAAASPFGYAYPGPGATIGQALVFGIRAGAAAGNQ